MLQRTEEYLEIVRNRNEYLQANNKAINEQLIGWKPPPIGWVILKADEAGKGATNKAGCGGIITDCNGSFISALAAFLGSCNVATTKLQGVFKGLNLAYSLGIRRLKVELDSKVAFDWLKQKNMKGLNQGLVRDCEEISNKSR